MRPRTLEEFVGQEAFLGEGRLLRRILQADRIGGLLFFGPPGCGKTTLAHIIAAHTKAHFEKINASGAGVKELREILARARERLETAGQRTILFVDELHRFNKAQQDVLLDDVEQGTIVLIGATTENPFFAVNSPLVSRVQIFRFEPLGQQEVVRLLHRAMEDPVRGLGVYGATLTAEAAEHLARVSDGDARRALTALEIAVRSQIDDQAVAKEAAGGAAPIVVDLRIAEESIQRKAVVYDAAGDAHYDSISAMIKSIRGSDPDAAVYWLAVMLEGGEDPRFLARRLVILAAEDIGNADPHALVLAQAAADATHFIGLPECQLPLAQAAIYLACAPKSNASAVAIWEARDDVQHRRSIAVPAKLRGTGYTGAGALGSGKGYRYPHDAEGAILSGEYYGVDRAYFRPTDRGVEAAWQQALAKHRAERTGRADASAPQREQGD